MFVIFLNIQIKLLILYTTSDHEQTRSVQQTLICFSFANIKQNMMIVDKTYIS